MCGLQAAVRHIIDDAERKAVHRRILLQLLVDAENLIRRRILAAETVAAADDDGIHARPIVRRLDIEIERLAEGTRLLRAVEDSNLLHRLREILEEMFDGERTIEMNGQQSDLLALCVEILRDLLCRLAD